MKSCIFALAIILIGLTAAASADSFFELDGFNGFYGSSGVPQGAFDRLKESQRLKTAELKCVAFTPGGDWVVLFGGNGVWTSNGNLPAVKKFAELWKDPKADFKCVAFAPSGGWTILWGQNGSWTEGSIPDDAFKKITEVGRNGGTLRSIAFAPNGGWVLLFDKTGVFYGGIPKDLVKVLNDAIRNRTSVRCVGFAPSGDWICLTDNGWWTSNVDMPASKFIAANIKRGYKPKWLAFTPGDNGKGPYRLETKPAQHIVATLTTDIAHPDAKVDEWYIYAPQVPNLPGQQGVKTTFIPAGVVVKEASPLKRSLYLTRIADGRKEVRAVLTIEATLMSRHLLPLSPGQPPPTVKELSPESVKNYTAWSLTLDFNKPEFQNWMNASGLRRNNGESDMDYAHRAFAYIKHHFTYLWPTPAHTGAETCAAGKSDCGGLSSLFASLMRANAVPARLLGGRWAASQKGDDSKTHVKAEFFAHGVGWVPVDASGAVGDTGGSDFACFGNDAGDFVTFANDQSLMLDLFVSGNVDIPIFQGLAHWWRGSGADRNSRFTEMWTVQKK